MTSTARATSQSSLHPGEVNTIIPTSVTLITHLLTPQIPLLAPLLKDIANAKAKEIVRDQEARTTLLPKQSTWCFSAIFCGLGNTPPAIEPDALIGYGANSSTYK